MKTCPVCDTPFPDQHRTCPTDGAVLIESRELEPGHIVRGKYRILRKLGQGGMGVVYLAEHQMLGGQIALKFLAVELSRNPQFVKRFRNEARAAYQLRHPNIVEVIDLDQEEDGSLFIAMEFVEGPSLRSALREARGPLPVGRALRIARGLVSGLAAAHARGAIHRDIKPENILLGVRPEGGEQAKILDFGIAVMTEGITDLSRTHGLLLTPEFAAPEQWRGMPAAELDGRTDLYALGGVLYEMLTGRTPFRAVNPEGWMFQHLQGVPESLGLLRPDLVREYPGLDSLVMRLLAREREQRFPSAIALLEALELKPPSPLRINEPAPQPVLSPPPAAVQESQPAAIPLAEDLRPGPTFSLVESRNRFPRWIVWSLVILAAFGVVLGTVLFLSSRVTAMPAYALTGGEYPNPVTLTFKEETPGATIYYTLDGSPPTEASRVYSLPLTGLENGTVVRAIGEAWGFKPSSEVRVYIRSRAAPPRANAQAASPYDQGKYNYDHKQYAQARASFEQACSGGEMGACNYLGYLYAQGLGGAANVPMAREVYQKACGQGNLSSCASLGSLYQDAGNGGEARKYFKQACDGGLADGCTLLKGAE